MPRENMSNISSGSDKSGGLTLRYPTPTAASFSREPYFSRVRLARVSPEPLAGWE